MKRKSDGVCAAGEQVHPLYSRSVRYQSYYSVCRRSLKVIASPYIGVFQDHLASYGDADAADPGTPPSPE